MFLLCAEEFISAENQWADPGQADNFEGYGATGQKKLFFGKVKWTGHGSYMIPPIKAGQDLLWVHIPGYTYKLPTTQAPNPNMDTPLPIMVDKDGRFGLVVPSGVSYVFVKMYGTLWKKIIFNTTGTDSVQVQYWNGAEVDYGDDLTLRYGDVNEDNSVDPVHDLAYLIARLNTSVDMVTSGDSSIFGYDYPCDLDRDNDIDDLGGDREFFNLFLKPGSVVAGVQLP